MKSLKSFINESLINSKNTPDNNSEFTDEQDIFLDNWAFDNMAIEAYDSYSDYMHNMKAMVDRSNNSLLDQCISDFENKFGDVDNEMYQKIEQYLVDYAQGVLEDM